MATIEYFDGTIRTNVTVPMVLDCPPDLRPEPGKQAGVTFASVCPIVTMIWRHLIWPRLQPKNPHWEDPYGIEHKLGAFFQSGIDRNHGCTFFELWELKTPEAKAYVRTLCRAAFITSMEALAHPQLRVYLGNDTSYSSWDIEGDSAWADRRMAELMALGAAALDELILADSALLDAWTYRGQYYKDAA